jgi:hypothetical protein
VSAAELLERAWAAGIGLSARVDGTLLWEALTEADPPAGLLEALAGHKAELLALLGTAALAGGPCTPPAAPWDQAEAGALLTRALARRAAVFGEAGYPVDQAARCHLARLADSIDTAWLAQDLAGLRRAAADYLAAVAAGEGLAGMAPAGADRGVEAG